MGIFYYVAMQQNSDNLNLQKEILEFDRDFALSKSRDVDWKEIASLKQQELEQIKLKAARAQKKADAALQKLEDAQSEHDFLKDINESI